MILQKNHWIGISAFTLSYLLSQTGCNDNNSTNTSAAPPPAAPVNPIVQPSDSPTNSPSPTPTTPSPSPIPDYAWNSVFEQTACNILNPEQCIGSSGFTVLSDGSYLVGPSTNGQSIFGALSVDEFNVINRDASLVASDNLSGGMNCLSSFFAVGAQDIAGIVTPNSSTPTIFYQEYISTLGNQCYRGDPTHSFQLHSDLRSLLNIYYPVPFPVPSVSPSPSPSVSPSPSPSISPSPSPSISPSPSPSISPSPSPSPFPSASPFVPPSPGPSQIPLQNGEWGGSSIQLTQTNTSTSFQFGCSHAVTSQPVRIDQQGKFSEVGTYFQDSGPIIDGDPRQYPATFIGSVQNTEMTITISYTSFSGDPVSNDYSLVYNQPGQLPDFCADSSS